MKEGSVKERRDKLPDARSRIWGAIRYLRKFTLEDLEEGTGQSYPHVRRYVRRLLDAGYLKLVCEARGGRATNVYRLVRDTGSLPPIPRRNLAQVYDANTRQVFEEGRKPTGRQLAWDLMRRDGEFTSSDLVQAGLQRPNALKYLAGLTEAGYVQQVQVMKPGPGGLPAVYRLIRDTGVLAPVVQRNGDVFDPNLEEEGDE